MDMMMVVAWHSAQGGVVSDDISGKRDDIIEVVYISEPWIHLQRL